MRVVSGATSSTHALLWALLASGCGGSGGFEALRASPGVFGVANVDDDDGNGKRDFLDAGARGDDDLALLSLAELPVRGRQALVIELSGAVADIRVWAAGEILLDEGTTEVRLESDEIPEALGIEFRDLLSEGELAVRRVRRDGEVVDEASVRLLASPLILNHHLQPSESSYGVRGSFYGFGNLEMIASIREAIGEALVVEPLQRYDFDPWVQDEFETATLTAPGGRIDLVIDSIRDRGLDPYPERVVAGEDSAVRTWGRGRYPTSQDAFGNLEVSPPVTVNGVRYPFGRIYWGRWNDLGVVEELAQTLRDQRVQDPFVIDVTFLCVGHADEFVTFVPDPEAPKGFRMLVTDTGLGYELLEGLDPDLRLSRYALGHGYATVGEILDDAPLRAINVDAQRDWIEPAVRRFEQELGVTEGDMVRIPGLFEEGPQGCFGDLAALIPGTVNLLVHTGSAGESTLFLPDPFLRPEGVGQGADPLIDYVNERLPASATPVWVDNWDLYHLGGGEVHCGTNASRTPTAQWWTDALHLIDGDVP